ncbi:MAG: hypothetical protein M1142_04160 [Patescibacteria group bacterium]|nr:hypothetical protein [Patescibacteria group bacterium]
MTVEQRMDKTPEEADRQPGSTPESGGNSDSEDYFVVDGIRFGKNLVASSPEVLRVGMNGGVHRDEHPARNGLAAQEECRRLKGDRRIPKFWERRETTSPSPIISSNKRRYEE